MMDSTALLILQPHVRDLGGFSVRRLLPAQAARTVGPFIFFDHMGPAALAAGGMDVRPHPHIGLATVTYLFAGEIMHRDSLGTVQKIVPGDINWMTAGSGIVHSERTPDERRDSGMEMHGLQTWVALPLAEEECAPAFVHYPAASLPVAVLDGVQVRVLAGQMCGLVSPVKTSSPTLYAAAEFGQDTQLEIPADFEERAVYLASGTLEIDGQPLPAGHMALLPQARAVTLRSTGGAHVMVLGGAKIDGERHIWWNFVSSSRERIEAAKTAWRAGAFAPVPGETDFIPLPEHS
jgi:redox-sensitive bicupin YhaK (pirin superfamily)